jgi:hypothetical protein
MGKADIDIVDAVQGQKAARLRMAGNLALVRNGEGIKDRERDYM